MRAFFGGQIKQCCRGNLAVVIERGDTSGKYGVFMYPVISEEFVHLTGIMAARNLPDRVYIGVSHDAGEAAIHGAMDRKPDEVDLRSIDGLLVEPHFLNANLEKPETIVLKSTRDGYKLV